MRVFALLVSFDQWHLKIHFTASVKNAKNWASNVSARAGTICIIFYTPKLALVTLTFTCPLVISHSFCL